MPVASPQIQEYFTSIKKDVEECYELAQAARKQSLDPEVTAHLAVTLPQSAQYR